MHKLMIVDTHQCVNCMLSHVFCDMHRSMYKDHVYNWGERGELMFRHK